MELKGEIFQAAKINDKELKEMYHLMYKFYDNMTEDNFLNDFREKDYCILLKDKEDNIKGFSTQKLIELDYNGEKINGVFSGDTIIHKEYWGSFALFQVFSHFFFSYGEQFQEFYWFLIVKGYKTYKILPTFLNMFYPAYKRVTPPEIKEIMDLFGKTKYPEEYNPITGVIEYKGIKDSLKKGIADITEKEMKNKDTRFFKEKNPCYGRGNDLLCIASLKKSNLKEKSKRILFPKEG